MHGRCIGKLNLKPSVRSLALGHVMGLVSLSFAARA
jgi:hypothetical protein